MSSPKIYAILPILNKSTQFSTSLPWIISDDLMLRAMEEREKRLIEEDTSIIFPVDDLCGEIFILSLDDVAGYPKKGSDIQKKEYLEGYVKLDALCLQTMFNIFSVEETMIIPYGLVIEEEKFPRLLNVVDFEQDFFPTNLKPYEILPNINSIEVQQFLKLLKNAIRKDPQLQTTLRRFCSTFIKSNWEDRLIDLTIALESLIPADTEISFQFSFFLSLILSNDKTTRNEIFNKLRNLYKARSSIVHGAVDNSAKKTINDTKKIWEELINFAKQCIIYRIEFINNHPDMDWKKHLIALGFGESAVI